MKPLMNTLYVNTPQAYLHLENGNVVVEKDDERLIAVPLHLLEAIVPFGSLGVSPALMGACLEQGIELSFMDMNGAFLARIEGNPAGNVLLRREQYRMADDENRSLEVARRFVVAKAHNQRIVLQRFRRDHPERASQRTSDALQAIDDLVDASLSADTLDTLRGFEGKIADYYFGVFDELVLVKDSRMSFGGRTRRPPKDAVNALLSFFYAMLANDASTACNSVGLDPYVGFMHTDRAGRRSLALDVMEEMRPYIVDRFVLSLINRAQVDGNDFHFNPDESVTLKDDSRKRILGLWQERKQETIEHPFLKEKIKLGLLPYVQAKLLSRYIRGDLDDYPAFLWR